MLELKDLDPQGFQACIIGFGGRPFSWKQAMKWLYHRDESDFSAWTDLSKGLRTRLAENASALILKADKVLKSSSGTLKFRFPLPDGGAVESVLIPDGKRLTACLSTQVGCRMGCTFCATGMAGLTRNLSSAEIIEQLMAMQRHLYSLGPRVEDELPPDAEEPDETNPGSTVQQGAGPDGPCAEDNCIDSPPDSGGPSEPLSLAGRRISHVVIMGMGEPFDNPDNLARALKIMQDDLGLQYSTRRITVSTCGHVKGMKQFAAHGVRVLLALSVGSPFDEERSSVMPVNRKWPISEVLEAVRQFPHPPRERVTLEYTLIKGVNDTPAHARALAKLAHASNGKINLIRMNSHPGCGHVPPEEEKVLEFQQILLGSKVLATLRKSLGQDIFAACGTLGLETE